MRNVYDCVEAFEKLLDKEYHLVLGRKNKSVSLQINFDKEECFHLIVLGRGNIYVSDLVGLKQIFKTDYSDFFKDISVSR